jgi:hypothetical protein
MLFGLQAALIVAMLGYFLQRKIYLRRRNRQSWVALTAQYQRYPGDSANPRIRFQHARVSMEMADYAERNGDLDAAMPDRKQLASLRRNAMEQRIASLRSILGIATPETAN